MESFAYRSLLLSGLVAFFVLAVLLGAAFAPASADVVAYREIFPYKADDARFQYQSGANNLAGLVSANWFVHVGNNATNRTAHGTVLIYQWDGSPADLKAVNSNPAWSDVVGPGYVGVWTHSDANGRFLSWSEEYQEIASDELTGVRFHQRNTSTSDVMRVALRVDSNWFVSNQTFQNTVANEWEPKSLSVLGAQWQSLSFTAGITLGAPGTLVSALPLGMVTGFGVYSDNKTDTQRIDSFTLLVPEPSTLLMAAVGMFGMLLLRRRRQVG